MLLALTGPRTVALLSIGGVFICFALASSFLLPRVRPDFPGRRGLPVFIVVTVALMLTMLGAMTFIAAEPHEDSEEPGEGAPALLQRL
ncbi:MAG: hypothetical protein H0V40_08055 [Actinobacteria bacterium]|nr:hypothetical protein [Actinomycetota bacterium]